MTPRGMGVLPWRPVALALIVVVNGCADDSPPVTDPVGPDAETTIDDSTTTSTTTSTTPLATSTTGSGPPVALISPPAGVRHCTSADVDLVVGDDIEADLGGSMAQLVVTNVGIEPCVVFDQVTITAWGDGEETSVPRREGPLSVDYENPLVEVGGSVGISLQWTTADAGGVPGRRVYGAKVSFGGGLVNDAEVDFDFGDVDNMTFQSPVKIWSGYRDSEISWPSAGTTGTPITDGDTLSTNGMGAVLPGMKLQETADATGQAIVPSEWGSASEGCGYARLGGTGSVTLQLRGPSNDLDDAIVTAVEISSYRGGGHATPSGLQPGSTEQAIFEALGRDRLTPQADEYSGETHWIFAPADPDEGHLAVLFQMAGGTVESIAGGLASDIYRAEGCA